jgi:hypothetical protein
MALYVVRVKDVNDHPFKRLTSANKAGWFPCQKYRDAPARSSVPIMHPHGVPDPVTFKPNPSRPVRPKAGPYRRNGRLYVIVVRCLLARFRRGAPSSSHPLIDRMEKVYGLSGSLVSTVDVNPGGLLWIRKQHNANLDV